MMKHGFILGVKKLTGKSIIDCTSLTNDLSLNQHPAKNAYCEKVFMLSIR